MSGLKDELNKFKEQVKKPRLFFLMAGFLIILAGLLLFGRNREPSGVVVLPINPAAQGFGKDTQNSKSIDSSKDEKKTLTEKKSEKPEIPEMSAEERELRAKAWQALQEQDWDGAIGMYDQLLVINSLDPELYNNQGAALRKTGQIDKAESAYLRALTLNPDYLEAMNNLAVVMLAKSEYVSAKGILQKVIEKKPDSLIAYLHLALALERNGELDQACRYYEEFLKISERKMDRRIRLQVEEKLAQLKDRS